MGLGTDLQGILEAVAVALKTRLPTALSDIDSDGRPTYSAPAAADYLVRDFDPDNFNAERRPTVALTGEELGRFRFGSRQDYVAFDCVGICAVSAADPATGDQAARDYCHALRLALDRVVENDDVPAIALILDYKTIKPDEVATSDLDRHARNAELEFTLYAMIERAY